MSDSAGSNLALESSSETARISVRLSPEARAAISEIQRLAHLETINEAIRRAISDELFLLRERAKGARVLLQNGATYREVTWPDYG